MLDAVGSKAWWQRGFALGVASHGIGTSRAFSVSEEAGTYAGLAMGRSIAGAVLIPPPSHNVMKLDELEKAMQAASSARRSSAPSNIRSRWANFSAQPISCR